MTAGSGCAGTRSSPPPGPQALEDHHCHSGTLAAAASCRAVGPRRGPHPAPALQPPAGKAPAETVCTAPRSSCGGKRGSGGVSSTTSPTPSCEGPGQPLAQPVTQPVGQDRGSLPSPRIPRSWGAQGPAESSSSSGRTRRAWRQESRVSAQPWSPRLPALAPHRSQPHQEPLVSPAAPRGSFQETSPGEP